MPASILRIVAGSRCADSMPRMTTELDLPTRLTIRSAAREDARSVLDLVAALRVVRSYTHYAKEL